MTLSLKKEILNILKAEEYPELLNKLKVYPPEKVVSYLIANFYHSDESVRWKAILGFGYVTSLITEKNAEHGRIIIRRLMWLLNEESGGMAWGVPEGFAEAIFHSRLLKNEYLHLFISYIWDPKDNRKHKADNYLEFPPAQRGVIWGIGRLAEKYKDELLKNNAHVYVAEHITSSDPGVAFLSFWSLLRLKAALNINQKKLEISLNTLLKRNFSYFMFDGERLRKVFVSEIAPQVKELFLQL
jgi:hypothetical protein